MKWFLGLCGSLKYYQNGCLLVIRITLLVQCLQAGCEAQQVHTLLGHHWLYSSGNAGKQTEERDMEGSRISKCLGQYRNKEQTTSRTQNYAETQSNRAWTGRRQAPSTGARGQVCVRALRSSGAADQARAHS